MNSISVVVPAYNEENDLRKSILTIQKYLSDLTNNNFEILIIENGSADNTPEIAKSLDKESSNIRSFCLKKASFAEAYRFGILHAKKEMVTLYPVDLAFSLNFIGRAYKLIDKYPIILGVRFHESSKLDRPLIRILISKIHTTLVNLLFKSNFNDVNCLKAFRTKIGKKLVSYTNAIGPFIEVELIYLIHKLNLRFIEIPVNHIERELARHPRYILKSVLKNFIDLFKYRLSI